MRVEILQQGVFIKTPTIGRIICQEIALTQFIHDGNRDLVALQGESAGAEEGAGHFISGDTLLVSPPHVCGAVADFSGGAHQRHARRHHGNLCHGGRQVKFPHVAISIVVIGHNQAQHDAGGGGQRQGWC